MQPTHKKNQKQGTIDVIDRQILNLLIANARDSTRTIAKKLSDIGIDMSERGIGKRITRLEKLKIICIYPPNGGCITLILYAIIEKYETITYAQHTIAL